MMSFPSSPDREHLKRQASEHVAEHIIELGKKVLVCPGDDKRRGLVGCSDLHSIFKSSSTKCQVN